MSEDVFIVPVVMLCMMIPIVVWLLIRHRERIAVIEKGLPSEDIKAIFARNPIRFRHDPLTSLKWGILFILGGLAVMLGIFLHDKYYVDEGVIVGMVCLFVGIGLIFFYGIAAKKEKQP
jgi:hypothetical protein